MRYLVLLLFCSVAYGQTVFWLYPDEPPQSYQSTTGPAGYTFNILDLLLPALSGYQHEILSAGNYARLFRELEKPQPACALGIIYTPERARQLLFSQSPVFSFFNVQVVMHRDLYLAMQSPAQVSLSELLQQRYRAGLSAGRKYTADIEQLLQPYRQQQIFHLAQDNVQSSLLQLVNLQRLDYTLEYPEMVHYIRQQQPELTTNLISVPIQEVDNLGVSWLACNNTPLTRQLLPHINRQLRRISPLPAYRLALETWQLPEQLPLFRQYYQQVFLKTGQLQEN